jgi:uncharacterized Ntn-hydrolase superfamily protein
MLRVNYKRKIFDKLIRISMARKIDELIVYDEENPNMKIHIISKNGRMVISNDLTGKDFTGFKQDSEGNDILSNEARINIDPTDHSIINFTDKIKKE